MNIQKADLKLFFKSHKEIADTMGVSKQWVDVLSEIKNPEQQEKLREQVRLRMKNVLESYSRIMEGGDNQVNT